MVYDNILICSLDRRTSCPNTEVGDLVCKPRKKRLNSTPNFQIGIPLGSQTAQLASKSFWNTQMLQTSMEKIAQCAARESSSSSSLESIESIEDEAFDENNIKCYEDTPNYSRSLSTPLLQQFKFKVETEDNIGSRVPRHPCEHEKSTPLTCSRRSGENTPPYLSPGLTKRLTNV